MVTEAIRLTPIYLNDLNKIDEKTKSELDNSFILKLLYVAMQHDELFISPLFSNLMSHPALPIDTKEYTKIWGKLLMKLLQTARQKGNVDDLKNTLDFISDSLPLLYDEPISEKECVYYALDCIIERLTQLKNLESFPILVAALKFHDDNKQNETLYFTEQK